MPAAVRTDNLSKVFIKRRSLREMALHPFTSAERVRALEEVSLEVQRGEIFGLLGPNGAGKTTLLKILSCLVLPTRGQAVVDGASVVRPPSEAMVRFWEPRRSSRRTLADGLGGQRSRPHRCSSLRRGRRSARLR